MTSLPIGAITPKTRENTTFLMAQGLKRHKTCVSEAPEWNSAAGAAHLWGARKTAFWHLKVMFYEGFRYFCERSVGAGAQRTDFVSSKHVSRGFSTMAPNTPAKGAERTAADL